MNFFSKCQGCNKTRFIIRYRTFKIKGISVPVKSNKKLCGVCVRKINSFIRIDNVV